MIFADFVGLVGVCFLVSAYSALTFRYLSSEDILYPLMNLIASILLSYSLIYSMNISSLVIEIFWGCISIYGLINNFKKHRVWGFDKIY